MFNKLVHAFREIPNAEIASPNSKVTVYPYSDGNLLDPDDALKKSTECREVKDVLEQHIPDDTFSFVSRGRVCSELAGFRVLHPNLPILPPIKYNRYVVSAKINDVREVIIPADVTAIFFTSPANLTFFVSFTGTVIFPIAEDLAITQEFDGFVSPIGMIFFAYGKASISIGLPNIAQVVGIGMI